MMNDPRKIKKKKFTNSVFYVVEKRIFVLATIEDKRAGFIKKSPFELHPKRLDANPSFGVQFKGRFLCLPINGNKV